MFAEPLIPLLSNWGETLIFRGLKQRKFVEFSQSDRRGINCCQQQSGKLHIR
jgi:hypothetical protein